jgi:hypothetical protein
MRRFDQGPMLCDSTQCLVAEFGVGCVHRQNFQLIDSFPAALPVTGAA